MINYNFYPSDKWLYLKIYCGKAFANELIANVLPKLISMLKKENLIKKWFFIRYEDPDFHIRLRFENKEDADQTLKFIGNILDDFIKRDYIWRLTMEPYQREINRYGIANINLVEDLFFHDSTMVCESLGELNFNENQLILFSILSMDECFDNFKLNFHEKYTLSEKILNIFRKEHRLDVGQKKKINQYYKENIENKIGFLQENRSAMPISKNALDKRSTYFKKIISKLEYKDFSNEFNIKFSANHLMCNRLFSHNQRTYEMLCYEFLVKYYLSDIKYKS